jgi:hypothetical protein
MSRSSKKSGAVWVCSDVRVDPMTQGHIYKFTIPAQLYQQEEMQRIAAFPAVEITTTVAYNRINCEVINDIPAILTSLHEQLDWESLVGHRNKIYRYILEADGIAGDLEFVDAYLNHDVLLSSGPEFVHDRSSHVLNTIEFIWRCGSADVYQREKEKYAERVRYGRELIRAYDENAENVRSRINFTDDEMTFLKTSLGLLADFSSAAWRKMDDDMAAKFDSFKLILNLCGDIDKGYATFLGKIGINTSEDAIKIYQNWFQLIFAVNGRLSDYADVDEKTLLQNAPDGAYVRCSENRLAIKIDHGIEQFNLTVNPSKDGKTEEYQVIISSGEVVSMVAEIKLREFPEEFIREIRLAEKKAKNTSGDIKQLKPIHSALKCEKRELGQKAISGGGAAASVDIIQPSPGIFSPANRLKLITDDTAPFNTLGL